jgi:DNA-binding CsgD family transcriptional regulator
MNSPRIDRISSLEAANESISWISGYETEAEVKDAAQEIVGYFGFDAFVFGALSRTGEREHHRYLVGCAPEWCYTYAQNKWYAIDPYIDYALQNTAPILATDIEITSPGQQRLLDAAAEFGYRSGVVVPAHSSTSAWIGVLYLTAGDGSDYALEVYRKHRSLMRAFALELLEWWDVRLRETNSAELALDELDLDLLEKAHEGATADEAAVELGVTISRVNARYEKIYRKLDVRNKRDAVAKAVTLGLIRVTS